MPAGFTLYLCVSDCTLPAKGTAHRANRNAGKAAGKSFFFWVRFQELAAGKPDVFSSFY